MVEQNDKRPQFFVNIPNFQAYATVTAIFKLFYLPKINNIWKTALS